MADAARIDDRDHPGLIQQLVRPESARVEREEAIAHDNSDTIEAEKHEALDVDKLFERILKKDEENLPIRGKSPTKSVHKSQILYDAIQFNSIQFD